MEFSRRVLEGYLAIVIVMLTIVTYLVLAGIGLSQDSGVIVIAIIIIILIAVTILNSIIQLRMLDHLSTLSGNAADE